MNFKKLFFLFLFMVSLSSRIIASEIEITQDMVDESIKKYGINIYQEAEEDNQIQKVYKDFSMKEPEIKSGLKDAKRNVKTNFVYVEGDMYRIYARVGFLTTIFFNPDEEITYVAGGDTNRWVIDEGTTGSQSGTRQIITLKPFFPNIKTNLVVNTSKRSYNFFLHSANDWYNPAIEFLYPQDIKNAIQNKKATEIATTNVAVNDMNFDYKWITWKNKKYTWCPTQVYDDGKKTFIVFRKDMSNRELPAIFIKDEQTGKDVMVRNRYNDSGDNVFILDRLAEQIILRLGKRFITIKRNGSFIRSETDFYPIRR